MSNTSGQLFSLPVIFVLEEMGRGSDFRKKFLKYPGLPSPIKNVPSLGTRRGLSCMIFGDFPPFRDSYFLTSYKANIVMQLLQGTSS